MSCSPELEQGITYGSNMPVLEHSVNMQHYTTKGSTCFFSTIHFNFCADLDDSSVTFWCTSHILVDSLLC